MKRVKNTIIALGIASTILVGQVALGTGMERVQVYRIVSENRDGDLTHYTVKSLEDDTEGYCTSEDIKGLNPHKLLKITDMEGEFTKFENVSPKKVSLKKLLMSFFIS